MALVRGTGSICQVTLTLACSPVGCVLYQIQESGRGARGGGGGQGYD